MGSPSLWHRRHALLIASQLPEKQADARLVVQAIVELLDTFMEDSHQGEPELPDNVLPFATG